MIRRIVAAVWLLVLLTACSGIDFGNEPGALGVNGRFVTQEAAQRAVDFKVRFPEAPPSVEEPRIEINKPPAGYVDGKENVRFFTKIQLSYPAKNGQQDEEIRVVQSLFRDDYLYRENLTRTEWVEIEGEQVSLIQFDHRKVYFWQDGETYIDVWIEGEQLEEDAIVMIKELLP